MRIDLAFFVREKVTEYLLPPSFFLSMAALGFSTLFFTLCTLFRHLLYP